VHRIGHLPRIIEETRTL